MVEEGGALRLLVVEGHQFLILLLVAAVEEQP